MVIDYKLSIVTPQRGKGGIDEADAVQFAQWLVEDRGIDAGPVLRRMKRLSERKKHGCAL